jgi:hypothetical protein
VFAGDSPHSLGPQDELGSENFILEIKVSEAGGKIKKLFELFCREQKE